MRIPLAKFVCLFFALSVLTSCKDTTPCGEDNAIYYRRTTFTLNEAEKDFKMADLLHNSDRSRLAVVTAEDEQRFAKYQRALMLLQTD